MKHLLGMVLAAGLSFGFANATFESAQAAARATGAYDVTPVAAECITYHHHYYCQSPYWVYGCIHYYGYIYCPAPRPYYNGDGGSGSY